jgi:hypothetical protein
LTKLPDRLGGEIPFCSGSNVQKEALDLPTPRVNGGKGAPKHYKYRALAKCHLFSSVKHELFPLKSSVHFGAISIFRKY